MLSAWRGANDQDCSFLCASFAAFGSASSGTAQATSSVVAGVQTVRLAPAFMGEQATYGPSYQGGLAPPPEWWLQFVHVFAPCQLAQLQQNYNTTWAQPCHWPTHPSTYPVNPTPCYSHFTPAAFTNQAPFCPASTSQPVLLCTNQPFTQPLASYAQPPPVQIPVATPTRICPPNPTPPSTLTPAQPAWADLSEELAPAKQVDELPTMLPKPNKGKGKGKSKSGKKPKANVKASITPASIIPGATTATATTGIGTERRGSSNFSKLCHLHDFCA